MMNYCRTFFITKLLKSSNFPKFSSSTSFLVAQNETENDDKIAEMEEQKVKVKPLTPTFNFAKYANDSELIRNFVDLGVDLSKLEKRKGVPQFLLKLDFERDVKKYLIFLNDVGMPTFALGNFFTKNPFIFKESIEDLQTRIYYLQSKKFSEENIRKIVTDNPYWLSFSTKRIDKRLGWFQKNFYLTGNELRTVAVTHPRLITYRLESVRVSTFSIKEEMGFNKEEIKSLILKHPKIWTTGHDRLMDCFEFVHNVVEIPHDKILKSPQLLLSRRNRMEPRYKFLKFLKRDQFDERQPGYVPITAMTLGSDLDFVTNICKSTPELYDKFLKTL